MLFDRSVARGLSLIISMRFMMQIIIDTRTCTPGADAKDSTAAIMTILLMNITSSQ